MSCFRMSVYEKIDRVPTASGSPEKPGFKLFIDEKGRRTLKENGKIDIYAQIQSHKESVDINYILARFANGDTSALSKVQGVYGDFTNIPTSLNELQNRIVDAERLFYQLPLETREQFEHNPSIFYSSIGTEAFERVLGIDKTIDNPVTQVGGAEPVPPTSPAPFVENNEVK